MDEESFPTPEPGNGKGRSPLRWFAILLTVLTALAVFGLLFWKPAAVRPSLSGGNEAPPMDGAGEAYLDNVRVENISLSRAESFIHQEVTIVNGQVVNGGGQSVSEVWLTIEFFDDMRQLVLRESRPVVRGAAPLAPGEKQTFEINCEHVPNSWNMQQPAVRVSYLKLASK